MSRTKPHLLHVLNLMITFMTLLILLKWNYSLSSEKYPEDCTLIRTSYQQEKGIERSSGTPLQTSVSSSSAKDLPKSRNITQNTSTLKTGSHKCHDCRKRLPHIIGIGVEKCGTSALANFMQMHPKIKLSRPKELYYWTKHQNESLDWYRNLMPVSSKYQLTMEYTPSYIFGRDVPSLLKHNLPDAKFIVMIRDPVIRAVSHYVHIKSYAWRRPLAFEPRSRQPDGQTWAFVNGSFETSVLTPSGEVSVDNSLVEHGLYEVHLRRWFDVYPRDKLLVIDEDVFQTDPISILQEVEGFLGISKFFKEGKLYFNEERGIFCQNEKACPKAKSKGRQHPTVDPVVLEKLKNYYHPFNLRLERLLQRKFAWT